MELKAFLKKLARRYLDKRIVGENCVIRLIIFNVQPVLIIRNELKLRRMRCTEVVGRME
jgi:hypothetical protein